MKTKVRKFKVTLEARSVGDEYFVTFKWGSKRDGIYYVYWMTRHELLQLKHALKDIR